MIAYCGIDCTKCIGYIATLSGDEEEFKKVAEIWSKEFNADVKPEHVVCDGCKAGKRKSYHCANLCNIVKCCVNKGYDYCIECDDFPCKDVKYILDNVADAKENLEKAR